jgi:hypothetical protein
MRVKDAVSCQRYQSRTMKRAVVKLEHRKYLAWSGLAILCACQLAAAANFSFSVGIAPPAPIVETPPPPPVPTSVWMPGYWSWDGTRYVWVPGQYVVPPFPGAIWLGGRWVHSGPHWGWVDGHWHHR